MRKIILELYTSVKEWINTDSARTVTSKVHGDVRARGRTVTVEMWGEREGEKLRGGGGGSGGERGKAGYTLSPRNREPAGWSRPGP